MYGFLKIHGIMIGILGTVWLLVSLKRPNIQTKAADNSVSK